MEGQKADEIEGTHDTPTITIDNEDKYRSRRGPNYEIFGEEDKQSEHNYRWFKVLFIGTKNVSGENLYIRDQTFVTNDPDEVVSKRQAQISPSHRLRDPHQDTSTFDSHFTQKANEMPETFSSSVRQHIVKQWVETKVPNVISVTEDKGNKGKNNKGVFKVSTEDKEYVVKVAVAPDSRDYEREEGKRNEVERGLGTESELFAQIITSEKNWHGLTLGLYPAAPGMTVGQGFSAFTKGLLPAKKILEIYYKVASELARFNLKNEVEGHYRLAKRMASDAGGLRSHNDANPDNILMDLGTDQVSFIDNDGVSINANPTNVESDVSSLMLLFTKNIGVQAGLEVKRIGEGDNPTTHPAQHIMNVVLEIINNIKNIYAEKIKNERVKNLITALCDNRLEQIKTAYNDSKE